MKSQFVKSGWFGGIVGISLFCFGFVYVINAWKSSIKDNEALAIKKAEIAVAAFSVKDLEGLDLSEKDLENEKYKRTKTSLMAMKNADEKIRFAYIYTQKLGKIYFVADSEPANSPDYSPPGQEYTEVGDEDRKPFVDKKPMMTKPVTDRWGTWVSVLIPIKSDDTEEIKMVFGMDYPVKNWNKEIFWHIFEAVIQVLALYLLGVALYLVSRSSDRAKENERNYRSFFESIDDIVIVGDKNGTIYYANPAVSRKLGYTSEELQEMKVLDLNQKSRKEEVIQAFEEMLTGKSKSRLLPLEKKNGDLISSETRVWYGKWNDLDCVFEIAKDLNQEQELLQKFNKIFEDNPTLMAMSSLSDGKFTDVNESFLSKLGYEQEEVIGRTAEELGLFVDPENQKAIVEEIRKKGFVHGVDLEVKTKKGTILNGIFSGAMIENQGKKFYLTTLVDQTETKRDKDELVSKNAELEAMNKLMVGRELKMVELKQELEKLRNG